jgi:hypothetical protein
MELRREEDDPEEQGKKADSMRIAKHVMTKMELRPEWLRGQAIPVADVSLLIIKLLRQPLRANDWDLSGARKPFSRLSIAFRDIRWCRGPESNWLRPPFQGGALPLSYPGTTQIV